MWDIFIQALGFIGIAINVVSVQFNKHWQIVLLKALSEFLFGLQYFFLGAYVGMVMDLISVVRNVIFTARISKNKSNRIPIIVFTLFAIAAGVFTAVLTWNETVASMNRWTSDRTLAVVITVTLCALVIIAKSLSTVAYGVKDPHRIRQLNLPSSACWLAYNFACVSIAGIVNEVLTIISIALAEIRLKRSGTVNEEPHAPSAPDESNESKENET